MRRFLNKKNAWFIGMAALCLAYSPAVLADDGGWDDPGDVVAAEAPSADAQGFKPLSQFPQAEVAPISPAPFLDNGVRGTGTAQQGSPALLSENRSPVTLDFPKVKTRQDEILAKKFSWWPTDARPSPVKDGVRSGYWWWPEIPGEAKPWGNQGYVYVRKIIFDYKSSEGEMKPSLVIKRVLKNVKVLFDFDKSELRDDARGILEDAMRMLHKNPKADILITGNADARGSERYNLKLGERRASAVQGFMVEQGLPEDRIRILSRGKLDAMAPTGDLVGMQKDRNAQFMIAEVEEVMIPAAKAHLFQDKVIEEKEEVESAIRVDTKEYTIQAGDTLWAIAKREYGDGRQWKRLYEFNKDLIPNPDRPRKGTKIKIPIE
ncbi:MAG: OmpA family protein [Candidatus Omnitrophica bacterium]|nr:OmpA family protein [Candidatus Omnitrophota bacterium]